MASATLDATIDRLYNSRIGRTREDRQCVDRARHTALSTTAYPSPARSHRPAPNARLSRPARAPPAARAQGRDRRLLADPARVGRVDPREQRVRDQDLALAGRPSDRRICAQLARARAAGRPQPHTLTNTLFPAAVAAQDGEPEEGQPADAARQVAQRRRLLLQQLIARIASREITLRYNCLLYWTHYARGRWPAEPNSLADIMATGPVPDGLERTRASILSPRPLAELPLTTHLCYSVPTLSTSDRALAGV